MVFKVEMIKFYELFGLGKSTAPNYLIFFTAITPLILFVTVVETRYRFQIYPLLAIFSGYFIVYLVNQQKFWLNKILWSSLVIILSNGLIDLVLSIDRFKERMGRFINF